ncbi:heme ABC transporter ATP-binding protein/permease CydC [Acerihabitans arboris]|uniref:Glutathione/L-cysteine transport system ATP-binding/permease protein CydC n=1 Tax=Acerihabitans arboris TaxID=2691583 RepID=A0A845SHP1_9GAMM|nr:cysteine/glutathione ABC transporter ATP-binding protein/permease CydC [Acerihabitans arboris]NDL62902.1 cysteine/glutathione ABC transporter ATP-binding protein/permease CydC [Acerihabitans arboris]
MRVLLPFLALYRRHAWQMVLGMALAIVTLLASIGLLSLSGWFLAGSALAGAAGLYSFNYMLPAAGVRGAAITRTAGRWAERVVSHDATFRVLQHLRIYTFQKILPLSPGVIDRFRQAELLNRLVADVDTLDHLYLRVLSPLLGALVVILVVTLGLCLLDVSLALTLGGIMLAVLLVIPPLFYRAGKPLGEDLTRLRALYRQHLATWLQGNAELTVYAAAARYRGQLDDTERHWQQRQQRQANLTAMAQGLLMLVTGLAATLILWLAADGIGGDRHPGAPIALFVFTALAAFEALGPVAGAFQHLGQVIASAGRIADIINRAPAVTFPDTGPAAGGDAALEIGNIGFSYPDQPQPAVTDLSLRVDAGEHIAILGHTGSGKSTLLQLLTRAWDVDRGQILLNGRPLTLWSEPALRAMMSVVPQRVHIFNATLRDNLLLGAPKADDARLDSMLARMGLDKLREKEGLDAWLGEGGRQLSGGEQRRIGIARALLHDAPLLLLDEPTEGLDAATERRILDVLHQLGRGKTVIIITHRLQGLDMMDKIYVMDKGGIAEQGTHPALMAGKGRYFRYHSPGGV